jgi:hypothetical protein
MGLRFVISTIVTFFAYDGLSADNIGMSALSRPLHRLAFLSDSFLLLPRKSRSGMEVSMAE